MALDPETQTILDAIWAQVLQLVQSITAAMQDGHLSAGELITLGTEGAELVGLIVRLITHAPPAVQTQLREATPQLVRPAQEG